MKGISTDNSPTGRHWWWKIRPKPDSQIMYCSTNYTGLWPGQAGCHSSFVFCFDEHFCCYQTPGSLSLTLSLANVAKCYLFVFNIRLTKRCKFLSTQLNCVWLWLCLWRYYEWRTGKKSLLIPDKITTTLLVWTMTICIRQIPNQR